MPPIPFNAFDERGEVRIYKHGELPHWRQDGCTYFVTFRLGDSLPQSVTRDLEIERRSWLQRHGIHHAAPDWKDQFAKLPQKAQREYERQIAAALNEQLDRGYGNCILRDPDCADIAATALTHYHGERVLTGDYVVMPNHVHALMTPIAPFGLEDILKSIKGFTAKELNKQTNSSGTLWQRDSYDHIVRDAEQLRRFQRYIAQNPEKAGLDRERLRWQTVDYDAP